jgi:hypothetical protein
MRGGQCTLDRVFTASRFCETGLVSDDWPGGEQCIGRATQKLYTPCNHSSSTLQRHSTLTVIGFSRGRHRCHPPAGPRRARRRYPQWERVDRLLRLSLISHQEPLQRSYRVFTIRYTLCELLCKLNKVGFIFSLAVFLFCPLELL